MLIDLSHQEGRPAKPPKNGASGERMEEAEQKTEGQLGWHGKKTLPGNGHTYIYIYPTKREVRKISIFKSAFLEGICDHSLEGTTTVRK